jgi:hypothetical protein
MLTGELRSQIDAIWNSFWTGGISNPLEVMEQITYLLFLRRLDDLHTLEENKSVRLGTPMARRIYPQGADARGRPFEDLRWSRFKNFNPAEMYTLVEAHVFPFLRIGVGSAGGDGSTYAQHMKDARFTIPTPALLAKLPGLIGARPRWRRRKILADSGQPTLCRLAGLRAHRQRPAGHRQNQLGRHRQRVVLRHEGRRLKPGRQTPTPAA